MQGVGLVLAGGGGKGAYHIGVWKALQEFGLEKRITAVSGTSVGALNTLLFANQDLELALSVWQQIRQKDILRFDPVTAMKLIPLWTGGGALTFGAGMTAAVVKALKNGIFSPKGIEGLILRHIDMKRISESPIPLYAGAFGVTHKQMQYLRMDQKTPDEIRQIAMASSALPMVFPQQKIKDEVYMDGSVGDNVPIKPLYDIGIRTFVVCYLKEGVQPSQFEEQYPDAQFVEIIPSEKQGGMFKGTLDFSPEGAARRIEQGYLDATAVLQQLHTVYLENHVFS